MNKKSIIITASVLFLLFISYRVASKAVSVTIDDANTRAIELYASTIKYAYTKYIYANENNEFSIDNLNVELTVDVKCDEKSIDSRGVIELHGCTVENSKSKYGYVNGSVQKEK